MEEDIGDGWIEKGSPVERNASLHRGKTSSSQERASTICIFQSWTGPTRWDGWSKPGMGGENSIKNKKKGKEEKTRRRGIIYSRVALNQRWNQSRKTCDNEGGWKRKEEECRRCSLRSEIFGLKKKRKKISVGASSCRDTTSYASFEIPMGPLLCDLCFLWGAFAIKRVIRVRA